MKIAYIAAGAANMYCGSCLHDNALAAAIQRRGHDVALIPTYTPIRTDEENVSIDRIFFGGINIYLQHRFPIFRHTPWLLDRLLDRPTLLRWVSKLSASTDAEELGELTISMLEGESGHFRKELEKLTFWLRDGYKPDLVQLTNSMFAGMAKYIKQELSVPVLCAMQGEDIFLEALIEPHKSQVFNLLRDRARDIDGFVATSNYYAEFMTSYLNVPQEKIHTIKLGINLSGHGLDAQERAGEKPFVIGYMARICPEKGLHILVEAFRSLKQETDGRNIKLMAAGYLGPKDKSYLDEIMRKLKSWGLSDQFEYLGEIDRPSKIKFLNMVDVLSVPTPYKDPKGLFVLEALANGVPVIQPEHGAFPELIKSTGGGILIEPNSTESLVKAIQTLINDPEYRRKLGTQGKEIVHRDFSDEVMAEATLKVYQHYLQPVEKNPPVGIEKIRNQ